MPIEIVVPEVGEIGMDVIFLEWLRSEGDTVTAGEALFEVDTDKSAVEVQAYAAGRLAGLKVTAGDTVTPRQVIGFLLQEGESLEDLPRDDARDSEQGEPDDLDATPQADVRLLDNQSVRVSGVRATPRAKALARQRNIDLSQVLPKDEGGLVTEADVEDWLATHGSDESAPAGKKREATAKRTVASWQQIPHFHLRLEVDVTNAVQTFRPTTAVSMAAARALSVHPECNLEWYEGRIRQRERIDLGLVVSTDAGLVLATVPAPDQLTPADLEAQLGDVVGRARASQLRPEDLGPRSLTISNLGMFAVDGFDAVLSAPDVLLLAVGRVRTLPRWSDDKWIPRKVMELTLATDHRALDGADAAKLLGTIEALMLEPSQLQ